MRVPLWTLVGGILLSVFSGILGGIVGVQLYAMRHRVSAENVLQAQRLELTDSKGTLRATMGLEDDGDVVLKMLSSDSKPMISLGILAASKDRLQLLAGHPNTIYPAPYLSMSDRAGHESLNLRTTVDGHGFLFFNTPTKTGKVKLGYWEDEGDENNGVWGLVVSGRARNGLDKYTGVGMMTADGFEGNYIIPHPADETH